MINLPSRSRTAALVLTAGFGLATVSLSLHLPSPFLTSVAAQTGAAAPTDAPNSAASASPAALDPTMSAEIAHLGANNRRLAPHDTFYLLSYTSAKTDKGVEGFVPGAEVHLVEVHRPTHTLVVSDGHAQVEVAPSQLTNDMDIAALVRQKDQASQDRIAAYVQAEAAAARKFESEAADATAKDIEHRQEEQQAAEARVAAQRAAARTAPSNGNTPLSGNQYFGYGGEGYGSPYGYFVGESAAAAASTATITAPAVPAAPAAPAAAGAGKVAAPAGGHAAGGRPK